MWGPGASRPWLLLAALVWPLVAEASTGTDDWLAKHGRRDGAALAGCPLEVLLSKERVKGFHVICVVGDSKAERLCIFKDGLNQPSCTHSLALRGGETVEAVTGAVWRHLGLRLRMATAPRPGLFTGSGRRLPPEAALKDVGVPLRRRALVLIEGGEWHWPPIHEGFVRPLGSLLRTGTPGVVLRTLALQPRIFDVRSFIEPAECDRMIEKARPNMTASEVSPKDADVANPDRDWRASRTSHTHFLVSDGDKVLEALDERIQNLTRISIVNSEKVQILRYDHMGRYTAHNDYFDPDEFRQNEKVQEMIGHGAYNRLLTVFMYMSNVKKGGETAFVSYGGRGRPADMSSCTVGLRVHPERQKVLVFYNQHPDGSLDPHSMHSGCPVLNGTKWSANYWMWNAPRQYKVGQEHQEMAKRLVTWQDADDVAEERALQDLAGSVRARAKGPKRRAGEL